MGEVDKEGNILKVNDAVILKSEAKHKAMIANISDVIAIMDQNGIITYNSPNIEKWFGWLPEDLVGTDGWAIVHPSDLERIQKGFFKLLDEVNAVVTVEYMHKCKNGSYKIVELTEVNLMHDANIKGVLLNYHDITERKRAEKEIVKAKEEAEAANAAKSQLLINMSHKIRTHMNGVMGMIQLMQMTQLTEEQMEYIRISKTSYEALLDVINLSNIAAKQKDLNIKSIIDERIPKELKSKNFLDETVFALMKASGFDKETCVEVLDDFCEQTVRTIIDIKKHISENDLKDENDLKEVGILLHKLKGSAGNVRAADISKLALKAEHAVKMLNREMLESLLEEIEELLEALRGTR